MSLILYIDWYNIIYGWNTWQDNKYANLLILLVTFELEQVDLTDIICLQTQRWLAIVWRFECQTAHLQTLNMSTTPTQWYENVSLFNNCVDWGDGWTACGIKNGCEVWPGLASQTSFTCKQTIVIYLDLAETHPLDLDYQFEIWQSNFWKVKCIEWHTVANNSKWMKCTGSSKKNIQWLSWAYEISDDDCSQNCKHFHKFSLTLIQFIIFSMYNKQLKL